MAAAVVAMQLAVRRTGGGAAAATAPGDPWAHVRADLAAAPVPAFLVCIGAAMAPHPRHLAAFAAAAPAGGRGNNRPARPPPLPLATAHLIGDADPVRPFSERLARAFDKPLVLRHPRGHVVPRLDGEARQSLRAFVAAAAAAGAAPPRSRL